MKKVLLFTACYSLCFVLMLGLPCKAQDLSNLSFDDRQSIELACVLAKSDGPADYHNCLNQQLRALGGGQAPNISTLSFDDRQSIELACVLAKSDGPADYHNCLNQQLRALGGGQAPNISTLSFDDRQSIELACVLAKSEGPADYHNCINAQLHALGVSQALIGRTSNSYSAGTPQTNSYNPPVEQAHPPCAENGSCYGDISPLTGLPKTIIVHGYYRANGTYVRGYYRSK